MKSMSPIVPRAFQQATIDAAMLALKDRAGARRFLVADEPGLGKTVVARGLIQALSEKQLRRPLVVIYVCSSQAIATQNVGQLVSFVDAEQRESTRTKVDRPGLIPLYDRPTHPRVHVYSVTPDTAYSADKRRSKGRVAERALACAAIEIHLKRISLSLRAALSWGIVQFDEAVDALKQKLNLRRKTEPEIGTFLTTFGTIFREILHCTGVSNGQFLRCLEEIAAGKERKTLTYHARNCLAAAALTNLKADLVVFDEFQKYRHVMRASIGTKADVAQRKVLDALTAKGRSSKLLMLSATPYEAMHYRRNNELAAGNNDFFEVLDFLHHNLLEDTRESVSERIRVLFRMSEMALRRGEPCSADAVSVREELTRLLRSVMCRTERPRQRNAEVGANLSPVSSGFSCGEIAAFADFSEFLNEKDKHWAVPLWSSVPLPQQMLGTRYKCWERADRAKSKPSLTVRDIANWRAPQAWDHFKTRKLLDGLPFSELALPWVRPSRAWWPLSGKWERSVDSSDVAPAVDGKLLVFSRFTAVPGALSGLVSFGLEAKLREVHKQDRTSYKNWKQSVLGSGQREASVFELFFASSLLMSLDPLASGIPANLETARDRVRHQLVSKLAERGIVTRRAVKRACLPMHILLIALTPKDEWARARAMWKDVTIAFAGRARISEDTVERAIVSWEKQVPSVLTEVHKSKEMEPLVELALSSPAVVFGRALLRHWPDAMSDILIQGGRGLPNTSGRQLTQEFALFGLRRYLDTHWFYAALSKAGQKNFAKMLAHAVTDGNLEAVFDEHFWLLSRTSSDPWPARLKTLESSLALSGGRTVLHENGRRGKSGRIRCHVALPLHEAKSEEAIAGIEGDKKGGEAPARPDLVRNAFNTPFWPMVLTTTSVGQEGLDFHLWCRAIGHWDPARGPVELEQREGRVDRYACLAVRRVLCQELGGETAEKVGSPWALMSEVAHKLEDDEQMAPWWRLDGASTQQFYFSAEGSRELELRRRLERGRAFYRMLLGMPDARALLDELQTGNGLTEESASQAALQLSAWKLAQADISRPNKKP